MSYYYDIPTLKVYQICPNTDRKRVNLCIFVEFHTFITISYVLLPRKYPLFGQSVPLFVNFWQ